MSSSSPKILALALSRKSRASRRVDLFKLAQEKNKHILEGASPSLLSCRQQERVSPVSLC